LFKPIQTPFFAPVKTQIYLGTGVHRAPFDLGEKGEMLGAFASKKARIQQAPDDVLASGGREQQAFRSH
jgi:hypothetical protein